jgi:predicted Zn finger-like uncharacterized protein
MPEQVRCPECNAALRVPDSLLGKNVKCPKCQTTFLAEMEELAQPEGVVRDRTPTAAAAPRPNLPDDTENEDSFTEDEAEDRPRRRHRGRSRAAAAAVSGPATAMMVSSILGILCNIGYLLFRVISEIVTKSPIPVNRPGFQAGYMFGFIMAIVGASLGILMCIIVLIGAVKMKNLRNYGFAITSCILSMLSPTCCCFLGLPFGIWGLVALNNPDVKDAFA